MTLSLTKILVSACFSTVKILPSYDKIYLVYKGNQDHYSNIKKYVNTLRKQNRKFYLYQRQPLDIYYEMVKNKKEIITYITHWNWETVQAKALQRNKQVKFKDGAYNDQMLMQFAKNHKIQIVNTFLDEHPRTSYHKICTFLGKNKSRQQLKIYQYCHFSLNQIKSNTQIRPYLSKLHRKYLDNSQIKLRKLDRIRNATQQQYQEAYQTWKKLFHIENIYRTTIQQQNNKRKLAVQKNIGEYVSIESLLQGYGQKSYYALWKHNE